MTAETVVSVDHVRALYGTRVAIDDLSFTLERGRTLTLVGPNGAGKSTLFRLLLGLHPAASGEARVLGESTTRLSPRTLGRLAFVPETHAEEPGLRVEELVDYRSAIHPRFDRGFFAELAAGFALRSDARVRELSRGQRAGLVVGLALAQRPELLLLDDPLLGLDPLARRRVVEAVLAGAESGEQTTLLAAHELGDVERMTDDVVLLGEGHGRALGGLTDLLDRVRLVRVSRATNVASLEQLPAVIAVDVKRDAIEVVLEDATNAHADVRALDPRGSEPESLAFDQLVLAWLSHVGRKAIAR